MPPRLSKFWRTLGQPGTISGPLQILKAYESGRRSDIFLRTNGVDILNRSLLTDFFPVDFLRGAGLLAFSAIGPLRRALMREGVLPHGALPRLMQEPPSNRLTRCPGHLPGHENRDAMKIATWNVNSVRQRTEHLLRYLRAREARCSLPARTEMRRCRVPATRRWNRMATMPPCMGRKASMASPCSPRRRSKSRGDCLATGR